ncbi:hypothetical protein EMIT036CA2_20729 [Chryseobacterium sp. IT-36CA2]
MLTCVLEVAWFKSNHERAKVIEEMEAFARKEIESLNNNY